MRAGVLKDMGTYIYRRQNKVAQYIKTSTDFDLLLEAQWRPGSQVSRIWWYQAVIYIHGLAGGGRGVV